VTYLNEKQVLEPGTIPGCVGNAQEPVAEEGHLCVYQGATATPGSLETEWTNAKFFALEDPAGNKCGSPSCSTPGVAGSLEEEIGALVVFRTNEFREAVPPNPITLAKEASLNAAGSYAVKEKR
jgi:hypothetical protein